MSISHHRISVRSKPTLADPRAGQLIKAIRDHYQYPLDLLEIERVFHIKKPLSQEQLRNLVNGPFADPIFEESSLTPSSDRGFDWIIEIGYKAGLADNTDKTAQAAIEDVLGTAFKEDERVEAITVYKLKGELTHTEVRQISEELLANPLIENIGIRKPHPHQVEEIHLNVSDRELLEISKDRSLALNLDEMRSIQQYFQRPEVQNGRMKIGLPSCPTDVEMEAIAQAWSEHCKHKIFKAAISYSDKESSRTIKSLFNTYIKGAAESLSDSCPWVISVFHDNAGIIAYTDTHHIAFKVETGNCPSALDPYEGALTGTLGVNRSVMGAGMGARLIGNTDVVCLAPPNFQGPLLPGLLHPKRIFEGVRKGIEHGGNKSGVPTVNRAIVFDKRYSGNPLVCCGTVGILPRSVQGIPSETKAVLPGDLIIIAGGRTGKDGIHSAAISSEAPLSESPTGSVQTGNPFTQEKLHDFLLEARDRLLYRALTGNGARGFSSSVGELAKLSGGCEMHLDRVLLKFQNLAPWEILMSESQERMTLAVPPNQLAPLIELANKHEVEICEIGAFTDRGVFHVFYKGKTAAYLPLDFLHDGLPKMTLEAHLEYKPEQPLCIPDHFDLQDLHEMLKRLNICGKGQVVDHAVQGAAIPKPLQGENEEGPGNAAILYPFEAGESSKGIVISNGICPRYSCFDAYQMAANAVDEAVRNAIAVGCNPNKMAILDNFCWPDPIYHEELNPDGKRKLAQLVRACEGLYDAALAYQTPIISGEDSIKNDYWMGNIKISIPPTLLISAIGIIPDVSKAVTMEFKAAGDWIYIIGMTKNELGGSEYALMKEMNEGYIPKVDLQGAKLIYKKVFEAMQLGLIASCHDCSEGGLIAALAESAFSGNLGASIDLHMAPIEGIENDNELLFSESPSRFIVSVNPEYANAFEKIFQSIPIGRIGIVQKDFHLNVQGLNGETIINENLDSLKQSWQQPLGEVL